MTTQHVVKPLRIALWFRYGPAEHTELFHAMPHIVEALTAQHAEVHYFGLRSDKPIPDLIRKHATIHTLPFSVNRQSTHDKILKTIIWLFCLPWLAIRCNRLGVSLVYIDETIPLAAPVARLFLHGRLAMTIADFFVDIYMGQSPFLRPLAALIRRLDLSSWRHLDMVFTRAHTTKAYLVARNFAPERIVPVYDPCDFNIYRPVDKGVARRAYGFSHSDIVLVHHGILHPNKGNDRILAALAEVQADIPSLRYLLVGDGPDMARLKTIVQQLRIQSSVMFTGWLPRLEDVNAALNAADIGLAMRTGQEADNFHVTGALVHSMACGLPVLAARLGGVMEVLEEGNCGFLFDPSDMASFKVELIRLARDAPLRKTMGDAALKRAKALFDITSVTSQTVTPLLKLVADRRQ